MTNATFRFYARLNAFLAVERLGQAFRCSCAESATTKHMIEALGVPHTEVALVLVNGAAAGLDWPIQAGERIAVYPKFEQLDVGSLATIEPVPPGLPRFEADAPSEAWRGCCEWRASTRSTTTTILKMRQWQSWPTVNAGRC